MEWFFWLQIFTIFAETKKNLGKKFFFQFKNVFFPTKTQHYDHISFLKTSRWSQMSWPVLGGYLENQDIHPRYPVRYQKWYLTDITVGGIWVHIWGVGYITHCDTQHLGMQKLLDIKDVDIWPGYQIQSRISGLVIIK